MINNMAAEKNNSVEETIRNCFRAYEIKDRSILEKLLSDNFTFSSPQDDFINKETYFIRCWPFSEVVKTITIEKLFVEGNEAFVRYEAMQKDGKSFRNTEFFIVEKGKIRSVDVYFGRET